MKFDVVIATMWREPRLTEYLSHYCGYENVNNIYIIDNDKSARPEHKILNHEKINLISYGRNIYVNPAMNEGYYRTKTEVITFLNDDVFVEEDIFKFMSIQNFSNIDVVGVHLKGSVDNYHIVEHPDKKEELIKLNVDKTQPIGGQAYAFGVVMFMKRSSYRIIPSLYQIWYGDDYLIQRCENVYVLKTSKVHGEISKTIVNLEKEGYSDIKNRINLDTRNAYKYNHFRNVRNWDIIRKTL